MTALLCGLLFAVLLFVDLLTKMFAHAANVNQSEYFLGYVKLKYVKNEGMMFSILDKNATGMAVVTALTVVMIVGIAVLFFTLFRRNKPVRAALAVIEAGAVGNLVDRLCLGYVRDFINVKALIFPEYTANIADICIMAGAIALVFMILFIGPHAAFPITKKWREEAKVLEAEKETAKERKRAKKK